MEALNSAPHFQMKMVIVGIIIINGAFLNLYIAPKLVAISFGDAHEHMSGELHRARRAAFAMGAVSATSWYSVFLIGVAGRSPVPFTTLLGIYLIVVSLAIASSQVIEHRLGKKRMITPVGEPPSSRL
jgi:hypothetical protein